MDLDVCTALVTPFNENNEIDYPSLKNLITFQLSNGIKNILILGTTGESPTISLKERETIITFVKTLTQNKCKLFVGTGNNNSAQAKALTLQAKNLGADGCVVVTPYYNKATQQGIIEYYRELAKINIPIIVYNVPSRTGVNIQPETMVKLAKIKNIVGIKEANGNIEHILKLFKLAKNKTSIFCGNDNLNNIFLNLGAKGTISVLSNAYPKEVLDIWYSKTDYNKFYDICNHLFVEPNPIPIKYALSKIGLIKNILRAPLTTLSLKNQKLIDRDIKNLWIRT